MSLVRADAVSIPLADESVDLIITSPPYFALRSYTDGGEHYDGQIGSEATPQAFLEALWAVTAECRRVLKPSGSLWVNLGDKYASGGRTTYDADDKNGGGGGARPRDGFAPKTLLGLPWRYAIGCIDDLDLILRAEVIWSKPNGLPESVTDRVRRSHEQWFHFTKEPRYFAAVDEVRESYADPIDHRAGRGNGGKAGVVVEPGDGRTLRNDGIVGVRAERSPLGKLPGSVWNIPSEPLKVPDWLGVDHFAAYPQEWPRRIILGWSPPDGVILDPFSGTGTTVGVACALGRFGVGLDLSADYLKLARWRIEQSGHFAKTRERTNRENQGELFGGAA